MTGQYEGMSTIPAICPRCGAEHPGLHPVCDKCLAASAELGSFAAGKSYGGIDPGKDGGLAVIRSDGTVEFHAVPTARVEMTTKTKSGKKKQKRVYLPVEMLALVRGLKIAHITIEKVQPMPAVRRPGAPAQGTVSAFSSGEGWGMWQMLLAAVGVPFQVVHASHWKAVLMRDQPKTKEAVIPFAQALYPAAARDLRGPKGALLIDRAEALLLAHFGRVGLR